MSVPANFHGARNGMGRGVTTCLYCWIALYRISFFKCLWFTPEVIPKYRDCRASFLALLPKSSSKSCRRGFAPCWFQIPVLKFSNYVKDIFLKHFTFLVFGAPPWKLQIPAIKCVNYIFIYFHIFSYIFISKFFLLPKIMFAFKGLIPWAAH